jgi:hypothetical protein
MTTPITILTPAQAIARARVTPVKTNYLKQALVYAREEMAHYAHFRDWRVGYCKTKSQIYQVNYTHKTMKLSKYLVLGVSNVRLFAHHDRATEIVCPGGDIEKLRLIIENMLVLALSDEFKGHDEDECANMASMIGTVRVKVKGAFAPMRVRYCNKPGCTAKITGYRFPNPHHRVHKDCGGRFLLAHPAPCCSTTV